MKITRPIFSMIWLGGSFSPIFAQSPPARTPSLATAQSFSNTGTPAARLVPVASPAAIAPGPTPATTLQPTSGPAVTASIQQQAETLLGRSEQMLDQIGSLSAKIRHQVDLFDNQISGAGLYLQQGRGAQRLSRFELKSQAGETSSLLLQICDGRYFWTYRESPVGRVLTQVNLERVQMALEHPPTVASATAPVIAATPVIAAAPAGAAPQSALALSIGGLPRLVAGVRQNFQFTRLGETQLGQQRVWVLDGQLAPALLIAAAPDQKGNIEAGKTIDLKKLPPQLPERLNLYISQADLMPCRIDYLRRAGKNETAGQGGAPEGYRAIVTLEIFDVQFNSPIDPRQFAYQPKGINVSDATEAYLKSIGVQAAPK